MSVFKRIKDIVNSNINSLLDKAEDSEKMVKLMISEMEEALIDLKSTTSNNMGDMKSAEKRVKDAEKTVARWQERAELAVVKGSDEMAKEAIMERKEAEEILSMRTTELESLAREVEEEKKEIEALEDKIVQAKEKLTTLPPKKVEVKVKEEKKCEKKKDTRFKEMETRINRLEAYRELSSKKDEPKKEEKTMEEKITDLEIEDEIARIKKEKGIA